jgi:hypothetical protein
LKNTWKGIDDAKKTSLIYRWITVRRNYLQMVYPEKELFADGISTEIHGDGFTDD